MTGNDPQITVMGGATDSGSPDPHGWLPACYSLCRHYVVTASVSFGQGLHAVVGTICGGSAQAHPQARGGPEAWESWPRCVDCERIINS